MDVIQVRGGRQLRGRVAVAGSKNGALPLLASALLCETPVTLARVPRLADVTSMLRVLRSLGMTWKRTGTGEVTLENGRPSSGAVPAELAGRLRASLCVLGPLLARGRSVRLPLPGGCRIGDRPVDLHLRGLAALGADLVLCGGIIRGRAAGRLRCARINLCGERGPTVTGTANVVCAAALARGTTHLIGAAQEPEIADLVAWLNACGARIAQVGSEIVIDGVECLAGGKHTILPDRIEAATLAIAAAITGGEVLLTELMPAQLDAVWTALQAMGVTVARQSNQVLIKRDGPLLPIRVAARPYPAFPTDVQAPLSSLTLLAAGSSVLRDEVFPERWGQVSALRKLGGRIATIPGGIVVRGSFGLRGAPVQARDLRSAGALVLAGLAAAGTTTVRGVTHLDRGYESLLEKLQTLGADVSRAPLLPTAITPIRPWRSGRMFTARDADPCAFGRHLAPRNGGSVW